MATPIRAGVMDLNTSSLGAQALATFRAIEHRRYFVRSTNSGVSAVIDPVGRVLAHTGTFERAALSHEVGYMNPSRTPYEVYGDLPWWGCFVAVAGLCVVPRRRRASGAP